MIFFTETVHICRIKFQKKNRGKKWMEIYAIKGGEGGPTPIGKSPERLPFSGKPLPNDLRVTKLD